MKESIKQMGDIIAGLSKERDKVQDEINQKQKEIEKNSKESNEKTKELYKQREEIEKKIGIIQAPHMRLQREKEEELREIEQRHKGFVDEIKGWEAKRDYAKATEGGEMTPEALSILEIMLGKRWKVGVENIQRKLSKKTNKLGIHYLRVSDDHTYEGKVVYLAFKGLKCIGLSARRKSQHPGDDTEPYSYIVLDDTEIKKKHLVKYPDKDPRKKRYWNDEKMNMRDWQSRLGTLTPEQIDRAPGIDLEKEDGLARQLWLDMSFY